MKNHHSNPFWRESLLAALATVSTTQATVIDLSSADSTWRPILFATGNTNDYSDDEQTGSVSSYADIVGNATYPGAMWKFDGSGTPSTTDGDIAFRLRLGTVSQQGYFGSTAMFGVDANLDANIDFFLIATQTGDLNNPKVVGGKNDIWIAPAGDNVNISPSTSSFDTSKAWYHAENVPVGATGGIYYAKTNPLTNIDGDGKINTNEGDDWYFAFQIPFNVLVAATGSNSLTLTEATPLSFVVATSNQSQNLNQDVGGVNDKVADLSQTWTTLGAITKPVSVDGLTRTDLIWTGLADAGARQIEWSQNGIPGDKNWIYASGTTPVTYTKADFTNGDNVIFQDSVLTNGQQLSPVTTPATYLPARQGSLTVTIANGDVAPAAVTFNNGAANYLLTGSNGIVGATGLLKSGSGTLTITNSNSYTGGTTIQGGKVAITGAAALGSGTVALGSATLEFGGTAAYSFSNRIGLGTAGSTLSVTNSAPVTVSGAILDISGSNTGALTKTGSGTLILTSGSNAWPGTTTIAAGTLQLGNSGTTGTIGSGNIVNHGTLAVNRSDNASLSAAISGTGGLTQLGSGMLILTGSNSYTGTTLISAGALSVGNGGSVGTLGTGPVVNNAVLGFNRDNVMVVANSISGTGSVTQAGTGTTVLTGSNSYGATLIQFGSLQIGHNGTTGNLGTGGVTNNAQLAFNRTDTITVANPISGIGTLNQGGTGTVVLTGSNSYSGPTLVTQGTLQVGAANTIPAGSAVTVGGASNAGTLDLQGYRDAIKSFNFGASGGTLKMAANQTSSAQLSATGAVQFGSTNTLDLTGMGTTAGLYKLVSGSSLSGTFGTVTGLDSAYVLRYGTVNANELDAQHRANQAVTATDLGRVMTNQTLTGVTLGTLAETVNLVGSSPLAIAGAASGSGLTFAGVTSGGSLASGGTTALTGNLTTGTSTGVLAFTLSNSDAEAITPTASGTGTVNVVAKRVIIDGAVTDLGLFHSGAGVSNVPSTAFSTTGSYATTTSVRVAAGTGTSNGISLSGAATDLNGTTASGTRLFSGTFTGLGIVSGTFGLGVTTLEQGGAGLTGEGSYGDVSVGYTANVYSGQSVWHHNGSGSWGTLASNFGSNWGATQGSPGLDGGFTDTDTATFDNTVLSGGAATVSLDGANPSLKAVTFNATVPGTSYTVAPGTGGTLTLKGNGGPATVTDTAGNHTISAPVNLATNANFTVTGTADVLTVAGDISGSGTGLTKLGGGTLTLTGSNSYSGNTVVDAGTLQVTGTVGGGTTSVNSGALLIGSGAVHDLALNSGGTVNPGVVKGIGTLTVSGSASFNPGGTYQWEMTDTTALPGVKQDYLSIDGMLNLTALSATETFTLDLGNLAANPTGWDNGLLPHSWTIAKASGGISLNTGMDVNTLFTITNNPLSTTAASNPRFFITIKDGELVLNYSVIPEPGSLALLVVGAAALLRRRRR